MKKLLKQMIFSDSLGACLISPFNSGAPLLCYLTNIGDQMLHLLRVLTVCLSNFL